MGLLRLAAEFLAMFDDDGLNAVSDSEARCANSDWHSVPHSAQAGLSEALVLGPQRRNRRWDPREKAQITAETFEPGANVKRTEDLTPWAN